MSIIQIKTHNSHKILENKSNSKVADATRASISQYDDGLIEGFIIIEAMEEIDLSESVIARIIWGYLYSWQVSVAVESEAKQCNVCIEEDGHNLEY